MEQVRIFSVGRALICAIVAGTRSWGIADAERLDPVRASYPPTPCPSTLSGAKYGAASSARFPAIDPRTAPFVAPLSMSDTLPLRIPDAAPTIAPNIIAEVLRSRAAREGRGLRQTWHSREKTELCKVQFGQVQEPGAEDALSIKLVRTFEDCK